MKTMCAIGDYMLLQITETMNIGARFANDKTNT